MVFGVSSIDEPVFLKSKRVCDLALRLIDGVTHLLHVELGDDVERGHGHLWVMERTRRKDAADGLILYAARGSVPERPKGAACKAAAQATLVRIQPGPQIHVEESRGEQGLRGAFLVRSREREAHADAVSRRRGSRRRAPRFRAA